MKKLTTNAGIFGPYFTVDTLEDRYRVDNAELPFSVVGVGTIDDWTDPLPTPPAPIVPVPASVTMRQARLALLAAGELDAVDAAIAAQDRATQITWEYAQDVARDNPLLLALAPSLGMDDDMLDDLFRAAVKL